MIQASTLKFLKTLQKNNNKPWFEKNRAVYEEAKTGFHSFVEAFIHGLAGFDPSLADLLAKNCIFRINRDVRFSKDKKPYKNHLSAYFNKGGKKGPGAGYYIHVEPGKSFVAAGIWAPEPAGLSKVRQEIDYNFDDWKKILNNPVFKKNFREGVDSSNILSRPPKGYTEENPAIEYIKLKSFVVRCHFSDEQVLKKTFLKDAAKVLQAAYPMVKFLNTAMH